MWTYSWQMGTGICYSEISKCANQFSHSVCLVYLGAPKLVGKQQILSHKQQICSLLTARDGIYGPWEIKGLLLLQCCLQAREICGSEWKAIEPDHNTDQHRSPNEWTKDLCKVRHNLNSIQREKNKRWEAWGSRGTCTFYLLATTEQHCNGIQGRKWKEHLWANRTMASLGAPFGAVLWDGP